MTHEVMCIGEAVKKYSQVLENAGIKSALLDAEIIIAHVLKCERHILRVYPEKMLRHEELSIIQKMINRRSLSEPVAYITGEKEFYSLSFHVSPAVLIPRPESEILVDMAMYHAPHGGHVCDIGTGSGAIAVALSCNRPDLRITATDISADALNVARDNASNLGVQDRIEFFQSDLFENFKSDSSFDLIISNPPYIDPGLKKELQKDLEYEPEGALYSPDRGFEHISQIIFSAGDYLKRPGVLLLEICPDVRGRVIEAGEKHDYTVSIINDYAGLARTAVFKLE